MEINATPLPTTTCDRPKRRLRRLLLSFVLVVAGLTLVGPASPAAAAGCITTSCDYQDPYAMGCAGDAQTVRTYHAYYGSSYKGRVEIRYSAVCRAAWVRVTTSGPYGWHNASIWRPGGPGVDSSYISPNSTGYSRMIGRSGQVCVGANVPRTWYAYSWYFFGCW